MADADELSWVVRDGVRVFECDDEDWSIPGVRESLSDREPYSRNVFTTLAAGTSNIVAAHEICPKAGEAVRLHLKLTQGKAISAGAVSSPAGLKNFQSDEGVWVRGSFGGLRVPPASPRPGRASLQSNFPAMDTGTAFVITLSYVNTSDFYDGQASLGPRGVLSVEIPEVDKAAGKETSVLGDDLPPGCRPFLYVNSSEVEVELVEMHSNSMVKSARKGV